MKNVQISEADQNFINSLSKIASVKRSSQTCHVYTIQINDCQLQLEFNHDGRESRWSCQLYSVFGNTLFEYGSNPQIIIKALVQREMKMVSRMLKIDLVNYYDSLKNLKKNS